MPIGLPDASRPAHPTSAQRAAFAKRHWVYGELVAQRAEEPGLSLPSFGPATTANTVCCQPVTRCAALWHTLRDYLGHPSRAPDAVDEAVGQSLNLIIGVMVPRTPMSRPPAGRHECRAHRVSRDLAVARQLTACCTITLANTPTCMCSVMPRRWRY